MDVKNAPSIPKFIFRPKVDRTDEEKGVGGLIREGFYLIYCSYRFTSITFYYCHEPGERKDVKSYNFRNNH